MRDDPLPSLAAGAPIGQEPRPASRLHAYLSHLYLGDSPEARRFRYALLAFDDNLGFLRIARALRVLRSYHLLRDLRADSRWFRCNEDIVTRTINFLVFMFVVTSIVYVTQNDINPQINNY